MSAHKRFFCQNLNYPEDSEAIISGEEFIHAKTVLRVQEGEEITLLGGDGCEYPAIVTSVGKRELCAHIIGKALSDKEPKAEICLLCGALKGDKTELVVQKATELGASEVIVFSSRYCSAYINENKLERLKKVAREAAKQCMRALPPKVAYCPTLKDALTLAQGYKNKFFACEFAQASEGDLSSAQGSAAVAVGSEGGFSEEEAGLARSLGWAWVSLGKRILRAETAAIAALSVIAFSAGELK